MAREGYDYSWGRPSGSAIKQSGRDFAVRYLFEDGQGGKGLDQSEIDDLRANGVDIPVVYEEYADSFRGYDAGVAQAQRAQAALNKLSLPKDLPIYFAVDWDTTEADQADINAALDGAASVIGLSRVGVYGSFYVMNRSRGHATWFWQTYAWSGGQVADNIHLYQYKNGQTLAGHAVDYTRALQDQFGQSGVGGAVAPAPIPAPAPAQSNDITYTVTRGDNLSAIAAHFGTTVASLVDKNKGKYPSLPSNPGLIYPGWVLVVSGNTPVEVAPAAQTHTVASGDNLSTIAANTGNSVASLVEKNRGKYPSLASNPNLIYPGWVLTV